MYKLANKKVIPYGRYIPIVQSKAAANNTLKAAISNYSKFAHKSKK
jgi:hypothetical protein